MISFDLILVFLVLAFILVSLYNKLLGVAFTLLIGVITLGVFGVLTPVEIISGFGNEQVAVVILILLFGEILRKTNIIENTFDRLFKKTQTYRGFLGRMVMYVAAFSALLSNTSLVAVLMPYIHNWSKRNNIYPSKLLIPLSYAAILGGAATLIGTSTNLIVNGMVEEQTLLPDMTPLQIFDFAWVGIPMILLGTVYLILFGNRLLPSRKVITDDIPTHSREYVIEAKVKSNSHLIGKTIAEAGLDEIQGMKLITILRKSFKITSVPSDILLDKGDTLIFTAETKNIADLITTNSGLILPEIGTLSNIKKAEVVEVVLSQNSTLINKTVRDSNFRGKYDAAIISVHRNGERIEGKTGNLVLNAGDVLLLFTGENFISRTSDSNDFYFISKVKEYMKLEWWKTAILIGGTLLGIVLAAMHVISLFMGFTIIILTALVLKVTHPKELPLSIDYNLALIIVLSLALGTAMMKSGAASIMANGMISLFLPMGKTGILFGIYLGTAILTVIITSKAAIAIAFPVALTVAYKLGIDPAPFVLTVAYAGACIFISPHGYVTNLMVSGPGGYSNRDFLRIGFPLTVLYMIIAVMILSMVYF
ncbi:MAG: SLC13 family permease [Bacteroidales bacterium]|nr:SLC13 family permease [Bacteroidales bacterium]